MPDDMNPMVNPQAQGGVNPQDPQNQTIQTQQSQGDDFVLQQNGGENDNFEFDFSQFTQQNTQNDNTANTQQTSAPYPQSESPVEVDNTGQPDNSDTSNAQDFDFDQSFMGGNDNTQVSNEVVGNSQMQGDFMSAADNDGGLQVQPVDDTASSAGFSVSNDVNQDNGMGGDMNDQQAIGGVGGVDENVGNVGGVVDNNQSEEQGVGEMNMGQYVNEVSQNEAVNEQELNMGNNVNESDGDIAVTQQGTDSGDFGVIQQEQDGVVKYEENSDDENFDDVDDNGDKISSEENDMEIQTNEVDTTEDEDNIGEVYETQEEQNIKENDVEENEDEDNGVPQDGNEGENKVEEEKSGNIDVDEVISSVYDLKSLLEEIYEMDEDLNYGDMIEVVSNENDILSEKYIFTTNENEVKIQITKRVLDKKSGESTQHTLLLQIEEDDDGNGILVYLDGELLFNREFLEKNMKELGKLQEKISKFILLLQNHIDNKKDKLQKEKLLNTFKEF